MSELLTRLYMRWGLSPKVIHSLPGRVRIELPALRKIPADKRDLVERVVAELWVPDGIKSLDLSLITGSVVIRYDATEVSEQQVLETIRSLIGIMVRNWEHLVRIQPEELPEVIARLREFLATSNHDGRIVHAEVTIPNHVWEKAKTADRV